MSCDHIMRGGGSPSATHVRVWVDPSTALLSMSGGVKVGGTAQRDIHSHKAKTEERQWG